MAAAVGAMDDEERIGAFLDQARQKYESEDQEKILKTSYVMKTSIDLLRDAMLPIVLRRSGTSKDPNGNSVLELRPYKMVTAWSPLSEKEQEGLDHVNEVQLEQKKLRESFRAIGRGQKHNSEILKWSNFLLDQKHAGLHPDILPFREQEKSQDLKEGALTDKIADDWNEENILLKASTRLLKTDEVIAHFWNGNPKPPIFREDGERDLEAEAQLEDPLPLECPRKFLVYVQYRVHRILLKKLLQIRGRGLVEYHGAMSKSKREAAVAKFQNDAECRVMLISNVGAAGLNLTAASVVIFVSGVWSGQEKKQIIGRAWRYGQTAEVIVVDIFAPTGLDLALAGYAGGKTVMSESFLRSEQQLHQARQTFLALEHVYGSEEESDPADEDTLPATVPRAKKSNVVKRKRKGANEDKPSDVDDAKSAVSSKKGQSKRRIAKPAASKMEQKLKSSPETVDSPAKGGSSMGQDPDQCDIAKQLQSSKSAPPAKRPKISQPLSSTSTDQATANRTVQPLGHGAHSSGADGQTMSSPLQPSSSLPLSTQVSSGDSLDQPTYDEDSDVDVVTVSSPLLPPLPLPPVLPATLPHLHSSLPAQQSLEHARQKGSTQAPPAKPRPKARKTLAKQHETDSGPGTDGDIFNLSRTTVANGLGLSMSSSSQPAVKSSLESLPLPQAGQPASTATAPKGSKANASSNGQPPTSTLPARRSPIHASDRPQVWQEKMAVMIAHQRGTTAKVYASGKRKRDGDDGDQGMNGLTQSSSDMSPGVVGQQVPLAVGARHGAPSSIGPLAQANSISTLNAASRKELPPVAGPSTATTKVSSPDHTQHKRTGFAKRSAGGPGAAKGVGQHGARTMLLNHRDEQVDKSSGPRSPSRTARMSLFPGNKQRR
ncbi:SNF2-related protein [Ceratobasidium theobromae]|uniref:SNF2-related protein n=1 Tax=Ceratobasidium theobromae TaxID=1582974 RepID=A0A5N5Q8P8_9AGAM|nr:SNF2-related protein [Ceratobasidium theobromae]